MSKPTTPPETFYLANERWLTTAEAAIFVRLSCSTLAKLRVYSGGPQYIKLGRKILYEKLALVTWLEDHRRNNTSETTK